MSEPTRLTDEMRAEAEKIGRSFCNANRLCPGDGVRRLVDRRYWFWSGYRDGYPNELFRLPRFLVDAVGDYMTIEDAYQAVGLALQAQWRFARNSRLQANGAFDPFAADRMNNSPAGLRAAILEMAYGMSGPPEEIRMHVDLVRDLLEAIGMTEPWSTWAQLRVWLDRTGVRRVKPTL